MLKVLVPLWAVRVLCFIVRGLAGLFWGLVVAGCFESYIVLFIVGLLSKSHTLLVFGSLPIFMKLVAIFICEDFKISITATPKKWGAGNRRDSE